MLSVITVTFNNFDELLATCDSLKDQMPIEHVVINGGNCQHTLDFLKNSPHIKSISEKDEGISDAFNKGVSLSTGDSVVFLNSGDKLIDKNYYSEALRLLNDDKSIDFVYADILFDDQFAGEIRVNSGNRLPMMPYMHPTLIVRRETMNLIGGFKQKYKVAMDLDFAYRLSRLNKRGVYIPRMVVNMDGKGVSSNNILKAFQEVFFIIIENKDYSFRSLRYLLIRGTSLIFKIVIIRAGLSQVIAHYRKKRYKINL